MSEHYTKAQSDSQAAVIGARIKTATTGAAIVGKIAGEADVNLITDAERTKLSALESSKFRGTFTSLGAIPTAGEGPGSYAHVDAGAGDDVKIAVWDADDSAFKLLDGGVAGETAATVKSKYESNANTNPFTDSEKTKLAGLTEAADISDFTAALDAALA